MEKTALTIPGGFTPESWDYARAFVNSLGDIPSSFTAVIRLLINDHDKNPASLTEYGNFFIGRLVRSPSIRSSYFYAIKLFRPDLIGGERSTVTKETLIRAFSGHEHAVMLSFIFLLKQSKKICSPDAVDKILIRLERSASLGWLIGNAIPAIGPASGMIAVGFPVLGLIPFIKHDSDGFLGYWSHLNAARMPVDLSYEFARWGCNSQQLASLLVQKFGLGIHRAVALLRAVSSKSPLLGDSESEQAYRTALVWLEALTQRRPAPAIPLPPKFYPNRAAQEALLQSAGQVFASDGKLWLTKRPEDLTPEIAPHLFDSSKTTSPAASNSGVEFGDPPTELQESLSPTTIEEISDKLIRDVTDSEEDL